MSYCFISPQVKNCTNLSVVCDCRKNSSVFIRKYEIPRISCKYQDIKTENVKKVQELSTRTCKQIYCAKKEAKKGKKVKKAENSPAPPLARAKRIFSSNNKKIEINKTLFRSLCYSEFFSKWEKNNNSKKFAKIQKKQFWIMWFLGYLAQFRFYLNLDINTKNTKDLIRHPA